MTERELRAAAMGIIAYEHFMQNGMDSIPNGVNAKLDLDADIYDGYMEAAMQICAAIDLDAGSELRMDWEGEAKDDDA